jgi:hypothetical protein
MLALTLIKLKLLTILSFLSTKNLRRLAIRRIANQMKVTKENLGNSINRNGDKIQ